MDIYTKYVQDLLENDQAYYAWETSEELMIMRDEAYAKKTAFIYRRPQYSAEQLAQFKAENRVPVIRFAVPHGEHARDITFTDHVKGETTFNTEQI